MLCQKCQATISEGEVFCPMCGAPVMPTEAPVTEESAPQEAMPTQEVPMQDAPMNDEQAPTYEWAPTPTEPVKKPKPIGWIVAAVIAVAAIVAAVVVLFMMNGGKTTLQDTWKVSLRMDQLADLAKKEIAGGKNMDAFEEMYPGVDMEALLDMFDVEAPLSLYVTFREDNTCAIYLNFKETEDFVSVFFDRMLLFFQDGGYYQIMEAQGYSRDEVDEMLAEQGVTMDTLILSLSMSKSQINASTLALVAEQYGMDVEDGNAMLYEVPYRYEDGKLSFAGSVASVDVKVNGNTLEIDGGFDESTQKILSVITIERAALPQ